MKRVYKLDSQTAETRGELDKWRRSLQLNQDCRDALVAAMRQGYDGYTVSSIDVKPVVEQFGYDRILWVLANTINHHKKDGRVSRAIIQWAEAVGIPDDRNNSYFLLNENPGLISILAGMVQKEAAAAKKPRLTLYQHSRDEAVQRGELDRWQASYDKNRECAGALTKGIEQGDIPGAVLTAVEKYGIRRVMWVLANTVQLIDPNHPSICVSHRRWLETAPIPHDERGLRDDFSVSALPSDIDMAVRVIEQLLRARAGTAQPLAERGNEEDVEMEDER